MPAAPLRSTAAPSPADKSPSANHFSRIGRSPRRKNSAAPDQRQHHHGHRQQPDEPDHDGAHMGRNAPQRYGIGIVRPNAFHQGQSRIVVPALGRGRDPASSTAFLTNPRYQTPSFRGAPK